MSLFDEMNARVKSKIDTFEHKINERSRTIKDRAAQAEIRLQEANQNVRQASGTITYIAQLSKIFHGTRGPSSWGEFIYTHPNISTNPYSPGYHNSKL